MRLATMLVLWLALAAEAYAAELDFSRPEQLVRLNDGRQINLICRGEGGPTIVIEAGWGSWSLDAAEVIPPLAAGRRVCAYDRAGLGFSDFAETPRSAKAVATDLHEVLHTAQVPAPYVLVGHSKGAVFVRAFVEQHRDTVAGVVLLDPGGPERDALFRQVDPGAEAADAWVLAALKECLDAPEGKPMCLSEPDEAWSERLKQVYADQLRRRSYAQTRLSEFETPANLAPLVPGAWGDLPLVVLTAEEGLSPAIPGQTRKRLAAAKLAFGEQLAALSTRGEHGVVAGAGHALMDEAPEAVVKAVTEVITRSEPEQPLP